jgi:hypothetical protein
VGRRSRKRAASEGPALAGPRSAGGSSRAERDAARRERADAVRRGTSPVRSRRGGERPPPPWGSFPLSELVVLIGIVLAVSGFVVQGDRGGLMVISGIGLASLAAVEVAAREHFAGYRSHTTLLAGAAGIVVMTAFAFAARPTPAARGIALALGTAVFLVMFRYLRQAFRRRSGGLTFR